MLSLVMVLCLYDFLMTFFHFQNNLTNWVVVRCVAQDASIFKRVAAAQYALQR